jgi:hypothetical protein
MKGKKGKKVEWFEKQKCSFKWNFLNDSPFIIEKLYLITCCPNTLKKLHECFTKNELDTLICRWPLTLHLQQILF